jgi:hypothetical protein
MTTSVLLAMGDPFSCGQPQLGGGLFIDGQPLRYRAAA